jgi:hypothetical protein
MENCPAEFEDDLKDFIDSIDATVASARILMEVTDLSHLGQIDEAHNMLVELEDSLY